MGCAVSSLTVRPVVTLEPDNAKDALRSISFKTGVVTPLNANGFDLKQNVTNEVVEKVNVLRAPYTGSEEDILPCVDPPVDTSHATNNGFDSHQADETGFLYRDVKNIANPKNIIAAVKRGDLQTVKELCDSKIGQESSVNALGVTSTIRLSPLEFFIQNHIEQLHHSASFSHVCYLYYYCFSRNVEFIAFDDSDAICSGRDSKFFIESRRYQNRPCQR